MRKPLILIRKQKSVAALVLAALIIAAGFLYLYIRRQSPESAPVFAEQGQKAKPNDSITDFLGRIME